MKKITPSIIFLIAFLFLSASLSAQHAFNSVDAGFSIDFPAEYSNEKIEKENATTYKLNCDFEAQTYFVSYSIHEIEMVDHEEMAQVSLESFNESINGQISSQEDWKVQGHIGRKAIIDMADNGVTLDYRAILVGDIQYQIIYLAAYSDYDEKAAKKFFKSFKINS